MVQSLQKTILMSLLSIGLCLIQACRQEVESEADISILATPGALLQETLENDSDHSQRVDEAIDKKLATEALTKAELEMPMQTTSQMALGIKPIIRHANIQPGMPFIKRTPNTATNREQYAHLESHGVSLTHETPVSTFSIDVDTGSYSNSRRMLMEGRLPVQDAVRVEEFINYFSYDYPTSESLEKPFYLTHEVAENPWNPNNYLLHIGIKSYEPPKDTLPASNLVFLVDVSGSMQAPNKLALLQSSLKLLTQQLDADDTVSLVVYAGASGVVLEPTSGADKRRITTAIDALSAGGSTNGASGIKLAYAMAEQSLIPDGINRVILATDGDFNVGTVSHEQLMDLIETQRHKGIALSTLGFGTGNYNDHLMEQLADQGNGNYAYIDTLNEAQKVLVDELSSTLLTVAKDVKIQIEFNPALVAEYRLIGYENRMLNREDFNNDKVDAGEVGAGHTVTALYEITPVGSLASMVEPLRYQQIKPAQEIFNVDKQELAYIKLRYKAPDAEVSHVEQWPVQADQIVKRLENSSENFRFSAAVAAFAQQLKGGEYLDSFSFEELLHLLQSSKGKDASGYRGEFLHLVKLANSLGLFNNTGNTLAQVESTP